LLFAGRPSEAIEPIQRAVAAGRNEGWLWWSYAALALSSYLIGDYQGAVAAANRSRALLPDFPRTQAYAIAALAKLGMQEAAAEEAAEVRRRWPQFDAGSFDVLPLLPEQRAHLLDGLRQAGLALE
jgi:tetratricopeptide (TPR) repeat protein